MCHVLVNRTARNGAIKTVKETDRAVNAYKVAISSRLRLPHLFIGIEIGVQIVFSYGRSIDLKNTFLGGKLLKLYIYIYIYVYILYIYI
jgi:hypothetical protein